MKLLKLINGVFVNPEHVSSVYVDMHKKMDSPEFEYPVMVNAGDKHFCVCICDKREEAEDISEGFAGDIGRMLSE